MRKLTRLAVGAGVFIGLSAWVVPLAGAQALPRADSTGGGADHAVFVQTDNTAGNQVVAYDRAPDGQLAQRGVYPTGGFGGVLNGSVVDHLASQGALTYDASHALLYAVNAGSNSVSVFAVRGDRLSLRQVVTSDGIFPVSVAVHDDVVYVLNAKGGGSVSGYQVGHGRLHVLPGSKRSLGLVIPTDVTQFTHTPGQVAFSPAGSELIVTTKANGNDIDVFAVGPTGLLAASPVTNAEPDTVPFGVTFDRAGHLAVADAGTNALSTLRLNHHGTLTLIDTVATGQPATCWVAPARGHLYASNAGGPSVSGYGDLAGQLTLLGTTPTDPGTVDASASVDGSYLYIQTGGEGIVDEFHVDATGGLTQIGSVTVPGAVGGEGIVAA